MRRAADTANHRRPDVILYHSQQLAYLHLHESNVLIEHVIPEAGTAGLMARGPCGSTTRISRFQPDAQAGAAYGDRGGRPD